MARTIKRKSQVPDDLILIARNYALNRAMRERAEKEEGKYKKELMTVLDDSGQVIEGGHKVIDLEEPIPLGKKVMIGMKRQRRAPQTLNQDRAEEFLKNKGLYEKCIYTVTVLNEDAILGLNFSNEITDVELKALYDESETFAFYPIYEDD